MAMDPAAAIPSLLFVRDCLYVNAQLALAAVTENATEDRARNFNEQQRIEQ
jgi:hypothetical protein